MNTLLRRLQYIPANLKQTTHKQCPNQHCKTNACWFSTKITNKTMSQKNENNLTGASDRYRFWKTLEKPSRKRLPPFKVVSYNILAQDLLMEHLYLYKSCRPLCLTWKHRLGLLTRRILAQKPDIICLQEVQEDHLHDVMTNLKSELPVSCFYNKKTGPKSDGCAILYNKNRFENISAAGVEFYQPGIELLDRHNVAMIAKFRCRDNPQASFLVATTHLLFNPKRQDVRLAQVSFLLAEIDRHSIVQPGKSERMPIIFTGDFNFQIDSAPFELITTGKLKFEGLLRKSLTDPDQTGTASYGKSFLPPQLRITDNCQHFDCVDSDYKKCPQKLNSSDYSLKDSKLFATGTLTHDLNLKSVYNHFDGFSYGSIYMDRWVTVDHMFYSSGKGQQQELKLKCVYQLPMVHQCRQLGKLPNEEHGSDHLMLGALFQFE